MDVFSVVGNRDHTARSAEMILYLDAGGSDVEAVVALSDGDVLNLL
jgi:hypothetical protein